MILNFNDESSVHVVFIGLLFGYKLILQVLALCLAFRTHNIKVKGLDDAKCIITAVYVTTINIVVFTMAFYALTGHLNTYIAVTTICIFISTTMILGLIFIPKVESDAQPYYYSR